VTPLYPQKLALTSPTGGGRSVGMVRSRTKATEFSLVLYIYTNSLQKDLQVSEKKMCSVTFSILFQERQNTWADVKGFVHFGHNILCKTSFCSCCLVYNMKCGC